MTSSTAGRAGAAGAVKAGDSAAGHAAGAGGEPAADGGGSETAGSESGMHMEQAGMSASAGSVAASACTPSAETCDGSDNDCDGVIDEQVKKRCWADADEDGFAPAAAKMSETCDECGDHSTETEPTSAANTDCDDADKTRSPGATDICGDNVDNNCDGTPDNEATNACGGPCMMQLPGKPGDPCTNGLKGACARKGTLGCLPDHTMACSAQSVTGTQEVCGDQSDNDCDGAMDNGCVKNACGGWTRLERPAGTACNAGEGACRNSGRYVCAGKDDTACDARPKPPNDCGGCSPLAHKPGSSCPGECGSSGKWMCRGSDDVVCNAPLVMKNACEGCTTLAVDPETACIGDCGEVGTFKCNGKEAVVCRYTKRVNACGGCPELPLGERPGDPCYAPGEPCEAVGKWRCEGAGPQAETVCKELVTPSPNVCGGCGELYAPPGTACIETSTGAMGTWQCRGADTLYCIPNTP